MCLTPALHLLRYLLHGERIRQSIKYVLDTVQRKIRDFILIKWGKIGIRIIKEIFIYSFLYADNIK